MRLEYNFSNQHLELIRSSADTDFTFDPTPYHTGIMGSATGDYIRMSVLNEDGTFIRSFYSNLSGNDEEIIYEVGADETLFDPDTAVIANPSGADLLICTGGNNDGTPCPAGTECTGNGVCVEGDLYPIYATDETSLEQYCIDVGYTDISTGTSIITLADTYYTYAAGIWAITEGTADVAASVECDATADPEGYSINWTTGDLVPQLKIYKDAGNNLYVKPNEALEFGNINEGNYQLQFDFLHNPFYVFGIDNTEEKYYFYITEISPSRKEVRLIARDGTDQQISIDEDMIGELQPTGSYQYDFVLALSTGQNIPILNYMIDLVSDPLNSSLILKLYFPLPTEITRLANVTIEQEVITTQIENIWYKTEAYTESTYGYGLGNVIAEGGGLYNDI